MKPFIRFFCLLATSFYAAETSAQIFDIKVTNYGTSDASVRRLVDEQIALIEADINEGLPSTDPDRLMEGMANSSVMAGKGIGTDYASGMTVFLLGAGVGKGLQHFG
jgi:hypothetical protein